MNCLACETGEHLCADCGKSYCIDHIHRHAPCTSHANALTCLRFALAEARIAEVSSTRMRERLQDALVELEQSESPSAPNSPYSDKSPVSRCVR